MTRYISFNGTLLPAEQPIISAGSRGLRYGDGLFETMRVIDGRIALGELHFNRLFHGLSLLQFQCPNTCTPISLASQVLTLCRKMNIEDSARIRINLTRANGGLYDPENHLPQVIIEAWPTPIPGPFPEEGVRIDTYPHARKSMDPLANLKSNNYLPYVLAALHAQQHQLQDCLLLNAEGRICDATIANVFWVQQGRIFTPPLSEGGVAGVMRQFLLENAPAGNTIEEKNLTTASLLQAEEIFLTNAIQGIRWVSQYREKNYASERARQLFELCVKKAWQSHPAQGPYH